MNESYARQHSLSIIEALHAYIFINLPILSLWEKEREREVSIKSGFNSEIFVSMFVFTRRKQRSAGKLQMELESVIPQGSRIAARAVSVEVAGLRK